MAKTTKPSNLLWLCVVLVHVVKFLSSKMLSKILFFLFNDKDLTAVKLALINYICRRFLLIVHH